MCTSGSSTYVGEGKAGKIRFRHEQYKEGSAGRNIGTGSKMPPRHNVKPIQLFCQHFVDCFRFHASQTSLWRSSCMVSASIAAAATGWMSAEMPWSSIWRHLPGSAACASSELREGLSGALQSCQPRLAWER